MSNVMFNSIAVLINAYGPKDIDLIEKEVPRLEKNIRSIFPLMAEELIIWKFVFHNGEELLTCLEGNMPDFVGKNTVIKLLGNYTKEDYKVLEDYCKQRFHNNGQMLAIHKDGTHETLTLANRPNPSDN